MCFLLLYLVCMLHGLHDLSFCYCLMQEWDIDGLSWDVQECGIEKVSVLRESIWVPDVHIAEL